MIDPSDDLVQFRDRLRELIGGNETPIDKSTLYKGIRVGRFPAPIKLGTQTSRWLRSEILACLEKAASSRPLQLRAGASRAAGRVRRQRQPFRTHNPVAVCFAAAGLRCLGR